MPFFPRIRRLRAWREAAEACGVSDLQPQQGTFGQSGWVGRRRGLTVTLIYYYRTWRDCGTHVLVDGLVDGLWLIRDDGPLSLRKGLKIVHDLELGDPVFDRHFLIDGTPALAHAVLDARTRQWVWAVLNGQVPLTGMPLPCVASAKAEIREGRLGVMVPEGLLAQPAPWLAGLLRTVLDAAEHLAAPRDVLRALAHNSRFDPLWAVRLSNLRVLMGEFPRQPLTRETLQAACADASEEVRLHAALALGEEADATLVELAENAAFDQLSATAITALGPRLPIPRTLAILADAPQRGKRLTALACIESIERHGGSEGTALLTRALSADVQEVRVAAARALGVLGTAEAVLPLHEAAQRFGGLTRSAARQAIARIQSRLAGATPGQVSMAEGAGGRLSLPDEHAGALSLDTRRSGPVPPRAGR
jgi:HEAT repeat protein